jgi:mycofactocin system glycosyltransferase
VTPVTTAPVPQGFTLALSPGTRRIDDATLFGGAPARVMRLSEAGQGALDELLTGPVRSAAGGRLARRLTDSGLAVAAPPPAAEALSVTVVIPVRDRPAALQRCLAAMGSQHPVIVVDDGSTDASAVARVAREHGARVVRRTSNGGPAAARNTGLALAQTDAIALLDSDCVPPADWVDRLLPHLADPLVAIAAPRVVARADSTSAGRYSRVRSCLDLGPNPAAVAPGTRLAYVPTAALLVRRTALLDVAVAGDVFDEALRYGEDVDLVWRLHKAGWRVRYDPSVHVDHEEPSSWPALLTRRFRYGTSAAPLSLRHPAESVALVLPVWPAVAVAGLLAGRPGVAAAGTLGTLHALRRGVAQAGLPMAGTLSGTLRTLSQVSLGVARYATQFGLPAVAAAMAVNGPVGRRRLRRTAFAAMLLAPGLSVCVTTRPPLGPVRMTVGSLADDAAYGAGVWTGCLRHRTLRPLRLRVPPTSF